MEIMRKVNTFTRAFVNLAKRVKIVTLLVCLHFVDSIFISARCARIGELCMPFQDLIGFLFVRTKGVHYLDFGISFLLANVPNVLLRFLLQSMKALTMKVAKWWMITKYFKRKATTLEVLDRRLCQKSIPRGEVRFNWNGVLFS